MKRVIAGVVAAAAVILVALALTTSQSQGVESELVAAPKVTKLSTVNGEKVLSSSLWQEVQ